MKKIILILLFVSLNTLLAQEYKLGRGYEFYNQDNLSLNIGAHADMNYHTVDDEQSVQLGQAGAMVFGEYNSKFRFLAEIGSDDIFTYSFMHSSKSTDLQLMRLYGEYLYSDALEIKIGQFLTPIGIWNRAYIPVLRWSSFTPYVAQGFFPKIIAGASLNGSLTDERSVSYSIFYHVDGEHDTNQNNIRAKEFLGGEVRYHFSPLAKIAIPFGRFRSDSSKEICVFYGANLIIPFDKNELSSEFLYKDGEWTNQMGITDKWQDTAWYVQYVQHIYKNSYLSVRYGEVERLRSNSGIKWNDVNNVFGYIYRPKTAFSVKLEYRHRKRDGLNPINTDESLLSFSVLF